MLSLIHINQESSLRAYIYITLLSFRVGDFVNDQHFEDRNILVPFFETHNTWLWKVDIETFIWLL